MEKTNVSKRVVAGTLALLTVFGSAPASLQGVFAPTALVANAADTMHTVTWTHGEDGEKNVGQYITSFNNGKKEYGSDLMEGTGSFSFVEGKALTFKSTVPLAFLDADNFDLAGQAYYRLKAGKDQPIGYEAKYSKADGDELIAEYEAAKSTFDAYETAATYEYTLKDAGDLPASDGVYFYEEQPIQLTLENVKAALGVGKDDNVYITDTALNGEDTKEVVVYTEYKLMSEEEISELNVFDGLTEEQKQAALDDIGLQIYNLEDTVNSYEDNAKDYLRSDFVVTYGQGAGETITLKNGDFYKAVGKTEGFAYADLVDITNANVYHKHKTDDALTMTAEKYNQAKALLEAQAAAIDCYELVQSGTSSYADGVYTYSFQGPDADFSVDYVYANLDLNLTRQDAENGTDIDVSYTNKTNDENTANVKVEKDTADYTTTLANVALGTTVKITSEKPFTAALDDANTSHSKTNLVCVYNADEKYYEAEFNMIAPDKDAPLGSVVSLDVQNIAVEYTFKRSDDKTKLIADSDAVTNTVAAKIEATRGKRPDETAEGETVAVATNGEVKNGETVTVTPSAIKGLATLGDVDVYKGDDVVAVEGTEGDYVKEEGSYKFSKAGTYTVQAKVKDNKGQDWVLIYKVTVLAREDLRADDFMISIAGTGTNANGFVDKGAAVKGKAGEPVEFKLAQENAATAPYTITVTAANEELKLEEGKDFKVTGDRSGSTVGKTYEATVEILNPEYGGTAANPKTVTLQWKVVPFSADFAWDKGSYVIKTAFTESEAESGEIEKAIFDQLTETGKAEGATLPEATVLSYEYLEGHENATWDDDELDEREEGVPTKAAYKESGEFEAPKAYTVYAIYNDEAIADFKIEVTQDNANKAPVAFEAVEESVSITFGDALTEDMFQFVTEDHKDVEGNDVEGGEVADVDFDVAKVTEINKLKEDKNGEIVIGDKKYAVDTTVDIDAKDYDFESGTFSDDGDKWYLGAGVYQIKVKGEFASQSYSYDISHDTATINVTVAPKALTADMITIEPFEYKDTTYDVVKQAHIFFDDDDALVHGYEEDGEIDGLVKITEGKQLKAVGEYTCEVKATSPNYTGTVTVPWSIVVTDQANKVENQSGMTVDWVDSKTTLYTNGKIHLEGTRLANSRLAQGWTVVDYGAIEDKDGYFDAPVNYYHVTGDEEEAVTDRLVLGNGFKTVSYGKDSAGRTDLGLNVSVEDVHQGVWARLYVVVEKDGVQEVTYTAPKFIRLQEEAEEILKLNLAGVTTNRAFDATQKGWRKAQVNNVAANVVSGYQEETNKYYMYASFEDVKSNSAYALSPENFGIIYDKTGAVNEDNADRVLTKDTTVGKVMNYDPNNKVLGYNELGINILPVDSVTDLYVRMYVDLGNDLIVYTDVNRFASVSEYYAAKQNESVPTVYCDDIADGTKAGTKKLTLKVDEPKNPVISTKDKNIEGTLDASKVKLVKMGIVVDKKGVIDGYMAANDDAVIDDVLKAITIDTEGLVTGKKTSFTDDADTYTGKVTTTKDKNLYVKPYAIYEINGKQVVVYGNVYSFAADGEDIDDFEQVWPEPDIHEDGPIDGGDGNDPVHG